MIVLQLMRNVVHRMVLRLEELGWAQLKKVVGLGRVEKEGIVWGRNWMLHRLLTQTLTLT